MNLIRMSTRTATRPGSSLRLQLQAEALALTTCRRCRARLGMDQPAVIPADHDADCWLPPAATADAYDGEAS